MSAAGWAEVAGHFRGGHGLEEELALEQIRQQQDRQGDPWLGEGGDDGDECEHDTGAEDDAERAELEAGAVDIGSPWRVFIITELEEAEFRDQFEQDGGREHQHGEAGAGMGDEVAKAGEGCDGAEKARGTQREAPERAAGVVIDHHAGEDGEEAEGQR